MKAVAMLFLFVAFTSCTRNADVCGTDSDCFASESCVLGECALRIAPTPDVGSLCDPSSCAGSLVKSSICVGPSCIVTECAASAVLCDEGCCKSAPSQEHEYFFSTDLIGELDMVVDREDRPNIFWFDFDSYALTHYHWDGATWRTEVPAIFPPPTWDYDVATDGDGRMYVLYTSELADLVLARRNDSGGWDTEIVQIADEPAVGPDEEAFIAPMLTFRGTDPYACTLFGTERQLLGETFVDRLPELWTFSVHRIDGWIGTQVGETESMADPCTYHVDEIGQEHLYFAVRNADETHIRLGSRFESEWSFNNAVAREGYTGSNGSMSVAPDGSLRVAYQVVESNAGIVDVVLNELRIREGETPELVRVDVIPGPGELRAFTTWRYVGRGSSYSLAWVRADASRSEYSIGRAQWQDGEYTIDNDLIRLPRVPDWSTVGQGDRFHAVSLNLTDKTLQYFLRD